MAKAIMIQGTMSNAGKSLLTAGLCRVFKQDGFRVAPFKSQNMALNSFITDEGLEMGRAQVVQAEACGLKPTVRMNPILLKPTSDRGSQVIVMGVPVGTMEAREYYWRKKDYIPAIRRAYEELAQENDIIVIEGAGSPAELNLKDEDIVNMGMARMADAAVLLVGDIDRGGVFAQLYGTVELLTAEERARVRGLIINKFKGDRSILEPGIAMIEEMVEKKVVGVIPYADVSIEDEDSLSEDLARRTGAVSTAGIDIAVIRFPRISNFTDFQAFQMEEEVSLRYVTSVHELGAPDLVILPGTKNTMADLRWLRESGLEAAVLRLQGRGTPVLGICGGYQMLGKRIDDPEGLESSGSMRGMGLLPVVTRFEGVKEMVQAEGTTTNFGIPELDGRRVRGYEVHMGQAVPVERLANVKGGLRHFAKLTTRCGGSVRTKLDGTAVDGVLGTYLHGLFDETDFREALVRWLASKKGIEVGGASLSYAAFRESQINKLAEIVRMNLDMDAVYEMMAIEGPLKKFELF